MDTYRDGEGVLLCGFLKTEDEGGLRGGDAEGEGFLGRGADVVTCFGEEEGLAKGVVNFGGLMFGEWGNGVTFAPALTAIWRRRRHWERLWWREFVEVIWPIAWDGVRSCLVLWIVDGWLPLLFGAYCDCHLGGVGISYDHSLWAVRRCMCWNTTDPGD